MKKVAGFTLVELLISLTLGLVISMMVMQLLISSNRTATLSDGVLQAQETGRFAVSLLSTSLQKAGFSTSESASQAYVGGCTQDYCIRNSNAATGDRIAIVRASTDEDNLTCSGQALEDTSGNAYPIGTPIIDAYWVENDVLTDTSNLKCQSYDFNSPDPKFAIGSAQPLVANVEALHVLYGIEVTPLASGKSNVTHYRRAGDVNNWQQVKAVKFSILTRSEDTNTLEAKTRTYVLLDADLYSKNDGRARQIFTTSVLRMN